MSHQDDISRGDHAKRILEDDLVQSALHEIEAAVIDQWRTLGVENKAQAEELKRLLWASQQFRTIFEAMIAGATMSKQELLMKENFEIKRDAAKGKLYG